MTGDAMEEYLEAMRILDEMDAIVGNMRAFLIDIVNDDQLDDDETEAVHSSMRRIRKLTRGIDKLYPR